MPVSLRVREVPCIRNLCWEFEEPTRLVSGVFGYPGPPKHFALKAYI
jgi:hypothetical protein